MYFFLHVCLSHLFCRCYKPPYSVSRRILMPPITYFVSSFLRKRWIWYKAWFTQGRYVSKLKTSSCWPYIYQVYTYFKSASVVLSSTPVKVGCDGTQYTNTLSGTTAYYLEFIVSHLPSIDQVTLKIFKWLVEEDWAKSKKAKVQCPLL